MFIGTNPFWGISHLMGMMVWLEEGWPDAASGAFTNSILDLEVSSGPAMIGSRSREALQGQAGRLLDGEGLTCEV